MGMGKRASERQRDLFIATDALAQPQGHPFYRKLNELLAESGFDRYVETICASYYEAGGPGRPSIPPGTYFRMLFIGYFEGIDSQRGIDWRCNDSLSLREFLGVALTEQTPDHSTLTRTRQRLPLKIHEQVFEFVLKVASDKKLLSPGTIAVDATTLEANAAMKSIVRKDTGEDWREYVIRLMREEGVVSKDEEPSDEDIRRFDKKRKKKVSNEDWESETDSAARIAKMKDGRTHMAYKAEHAIDLESEMILAAMILPANAGDADTLIDTVLAAQGHLNAAAALDPSNPQPMDEEKVASVNASKIREVVADKAYHKASTIELADDLGLRTYIPERREKNKRRWDDKPLSHRTAVVNNRRRVRRAKSKRLQRLRSERVERSFAHVCDTGGSRRTWLRGFEKVSKRYLMQVAARNLALILRHLFGMGKPRTLQPEGPYVIFALWTVLWIAWSRCWSSLAPSHAIRRVIKQIPAPKSSAPTFLIKMA